MPKLSPIPVSVLNLNGDVPNVLKEVTLARQSRCL